MTAFDSTTQGGTPAFLHLTTILMSTTQIEAGGVEKIKNNREELEYLAEHGEHADWIAEILLEAIDQ